MWTLADKYGYLTPEKAARVLMERLKPFGPFLYHRASTRRSYYIHFSNLPCGFDHKLRVSDHPEQEKYGYKWQLRLDAKGKHIARRPDKRHCRFYSSIDALVEAFEHYYSEKEKCDAELYAAFTAAGGE